MEINIEFNRLLKNYSLATAGGMGSMAALTYPAFGSV